MHQATWPSGPYGDVYVALHASLQPSARVIAPGTDAAIGRTLDFLRARGDAGALKILEAISVTVETLRHQARSRESAAHASTRVELARLAHDWLAAAPMFPPAASAGESAARLQ